MEIWRPIEDTKGRLEVSNYTESGSTSKAIVSRDRR